MKRLIDEHRSPSHCEKASAHAQLSPIMELVASVQKQVIEYRSRLDQDVLADESLHGRAERYHQTLGAMEREASEVQAHARLLARTFSQLDRYVVEDTAAKSPGDDRVAAHP